MQTRRQMSVIFVITLFLFFFVTPSNCQDDALFLTPYIKNGQIKEAQKLATVPPMLKNVKSFAGFLTVNKTCNSNLFFWLFKSRRGKWEERPLVVWLQGGPGGSSLFGLFEEVGPLFVKKGGTPARRRYAWNEKYNVVFIDNPVGAGFSFTETDSGYAKDLTESTGDLYESLVQLYELFPALKGNKLFLAGESYAAKFVTVMAHKIFKTNPVSAFQMNLAGVISVSGFIDPITSTKYGFHLHNLGLLDNVQLQKFVLREEEVRANIKAGDYLTASKKWTEERQDMNNITGFKHLLDFVRDYMGSDANAPAVRFLNRTDTRRAIHVGSHKIHSGEEVRFHMRYDTMRSVKPQLEELLSAEPFPFLFLIGQLDILSAYSLVTEFYDSLQWPHAKDYFRAKRCLFRVGNRVAGYYRTAGTFTEVLVRNTGHMLAAGQPKWAFKLMDTFITNATSFYCA